MLQDNSKINIFLGSFLTRVLEYPSKRDLSRVLTKDMKESIRGYVKDENSLFQTAQLYLDGLVGSKSTLQKKIKRAYETNATNVEILDDFLENDKINAIFSTDYDLTLEKINLSKVRKIVPTDEKIPDEISEIKLYKLLGDVTRYDLMFASTQDFKKLKLLEIHKKFFDKVREEIENYPTLIMDIDLNDVDFIEVLEFILKGVKNKENIYATTISNVLKAKTIERLNGLGVKFLPYSEEQLYSELKNFLSIDFDIEKGIKNNIIEKKYIR